MDPANHTLRVLIELRAEIRAEMSALRGDITDLRTDVHVLRGDVTDMREEMRARFDAADRRMDIADGVARDTQAMVRWHGRMLRNLAATKRKHADRLDDLERRRDR